MCYMKMELKLLSQKTVDVSEGIHRQICVM